MTEEIILQALKLLKLKHFCQFMKCVSGTYECSLLDCPTCKAYNLYHKLFIVKGLA